MNTQIKFTFRSGYYITGCYISDQKETADSILQKMHKTVEESVKDIPIFGEEKNPEPVTPNQIKVHEFTLFNKDGVKKAHGPETWVECTQVRTVEIMSPTTM